MGRENQGEEQGEWRSSDSVRTQNTTTIHSPTHPNTKKYSANTPNKLDHYSETPKTRGLKKVRKRDENCVEKLKKQPNFYSREGITHICIFHYQANDFIYVQRGLTRG
jgi:hypothetical protein